MCSSTGISQQASATVLFQNLYMGMTLSVRSDSVNSKFKNVSCKQIFERDKWLKMYFKFLRFVFQLQIKFGLIASQSIN
jgi:hypothetical protein